MINCHNSFRARQDVGDILYIKHPDGWKWIPSTVVAVHKHAFVTYYVLEVVAPVINDTYLEMRSMYNVRTLNELVDKGLDYEQ